MSLEHDKRLEAAIDRELKGLPELTAPAELVSRVMAAVERQQRLPWHRQAWQAWPASVRRAGLVLLVALFGGLCYGGWELSQGASLGAVGDRASGELATLGVLWRALGVVVDAAKLVVDQIGSGWLLACLAAVAAGYALCIGLGTMAVRFANARR